MEANHNRHHRLCYPPVGGVNSKGIFFGDDPLRYSLPVLTLQIILFIFFSHVIHAALKPLGQPMIVSQILGGLILGPTVLGRIKVFADTVFPTEGKVLLDTFALFGFIFFQMLIGVRMELDLVVGAGRMTIAIGFLGFVIPFLVGGVISLLVSTYMTIDPDIAMSITFVVGAQSMSSFAVVACLLSHLKILSSELGRLAASAAVISEFCAFITFILLNNVNMLMERNAVRISSASLMSITLLSGFIVFIVRPAALWVIRHTPEGKQVHQSYIYGFIVTLMGCSFVGQFIGQGYFMIPFLFGLVIPGGPPLGTALEDRIDTFVSMILMPIFYCVCGLKTDLLAITKLKNVWLIQIIVVTCFVGKTVGVILPPLYYKMPFRDAATLSLVMNSKGVAELAIYSGMYGDKILDRQSFSILIMSLVIVSTFVSCLVRRLYDPSRRYLPYMKRTIQHMPLDTELGILACVHNQDNVPPIIKIIEASYPHKASPIHICVLHLVNLVARSASLLISHNRNTKPSSKRKGSEHIVKAFRQYEDKKRGVVSVAALTSISPSGTMYDDVCSLALQKRSFLIIIPFHKQWLGGGVEYSSTQIRAFNINVLNKAPCSVGILVDRSNLVSPPSLSRSLFYDIALLFFGGADDREALSYASRMANHPNVRLIVIRIMAKEAAASDDVKMDIYDNDSLNKFRTSTCHNNKVAYVQVEVKDCSGVVKAIKSLEKGYDLVMVGRRHFESPLTSGLKEWTEYPELGIFGDLLVAPDFEGVSSVMVVQQQARVWGMLQPENFI